MDWSAQFDNYCERTDLTLWSEPLNAVTNAAFIIVALIMAYRTKGSFGAGILSFILFAIGIGSFLFHTKATAWAGLADTAPIGLFIFVYLFLINRSVLSWPLWGAVLGTLAFVPFAAVVVPVVNQFPFIAISSFYWTVPLLLVIYGIALRHRRLQVARGLLIGAAILSISIIVRSLDEMLCPVWPYGTHFGWHLLNAIMLGYMIHVYHGHVLAGGRRQR